MADLLSWMISMTFPKRLVQLRKERLFTQQTLADAIGINVSQLKRYEAGTSQPTLDVLRRLAVTLAVSGDALLFDEHERGPDEELRFQFEAISQLPAEEKQAIRSLLEGMIVKHQTKKIMDNLGR